MADINSIDNDPNSYYTPPSGGEVKPAKGFLQETAEAVPRVVGGIAESVGKSLRALNIQSRAGGIATQQAIPEALKTGGEAAQNWGQKVQQDFEISPETQAAHPLFTKAAGFAEGLAKLVPLFAASAIPGVGPAVLPAALSAEQFSNTYDTGLAHGLSEKDSAHAAALAATSTAATMAAMGPLGEVAGAAAAPAAKVAGDVLNRTISQSLKEYAAGTLTDVGVLAGGTAATAGIEKATGARPEAQPLKEALSPESLIPNVLMAGAFRGVATVQGLRGMAGMRKAMENPETPFVQRQAVAEYIEKEIRKPGTPEAIQAANDFGVGASKALQNNEPIPMGGPQPKAEAVDLHDKITSALQDHVETGVDLAKTIQEKTAPEVAQEIKDAQILKEIQDFKEVPNAVNERGGGEGEGLQLPRAGEVPEGEGAHRNVTGAEEQRGGTETNGGNRPLEGEGVQEKIEPIKAGEVRSPYPDNPNVKIMMGTPQEVDPATGKRVDVLDPATGKPVKEIRLVDTSERNKGLIASAEITKDGKLGDLIERPGVPDKADQIANVTALLKNHVEGKEATPEAKFSVEGAFPEKRSPSKTEKIFVGKDLETDVLRNPSQERAERLFDKAQRAMKQRGAGEEETNLRFTVDKNTGDLYMWDAYDATHPDIIKGLKEQSGVIIDSMQGDLPGQQKNKIITNKEGIKYTLEHRGTTPSDADFIAQMKTRLNAETNTPEARMSVGEGGVAPGEKPVEAKAAEKQEPAALLSEILKKLYHMDAEFTRVEPKGEMAIAAKALSEAVGKEFVLLVEPKGQNVHLGGAVLPSHPDYIFVLAKSNNPILHAALHETLHQYKIDCENGTLGEENRDGYARLEKAITPFLKNLPEREAALNLARKEAGYTPLKEGVVTEERIAECMSDQSTSKDFWNKVWAVDKTAVQRIYDIVSKIIDSLKDVFKSRVPNQDIANLMKVRDLLAEHLGGYIKAVKDIQEAKTAQTPQEYAQNYDMAASLKESLKPFYSKMENFVEAKFPGKASGSDAKSLLETWAKKGEISKAELDASGILEDLQGKTRVTKQDVLDAIRANTVELKDVVLGEPSEPWYIFKNEEESTYAGEDRFDVIDQRTGFTKYTGGLKDSQQYTSDHNKQTTTHFSQYTEPGAVEGSYREMFVTAPDKNADMRTPEQLLAREKQIIDESKQDPSFPSNAVAQGTWLHANRPEWTEIRDRLNKRPGEGQWSDGHSQYSDIQNPVARIRFNEREVDGKRIMFVEEMQGPSDAEQSKMPEYLQKRIYDLGVKRVLAYAKENGFDGVAWTTGEMQAKRYDLSKQINSMQYEKNGNGSYEVDIFGKDGGVVKSFEEAQLPEIESYIGKELTKKIADGTGTPGDGTNVRPSIKTLSGLDLKVGGEGLKSLYDKTLPSLFKKYGKEGVGKTTIETGKTGFLEARYEGPVLTAAEIRAKAETLNDFMFKKQLNKLADALIEGKDYQESASELLSEGAANKIGGKLTNLNQIAERTVPFIPITEVTPESYPKFSITPQEVAESLRDNKFIKDDVKPAIVRAVSAVKNIADGIAKGVAPGGRTADSAKAQDQFREVLGKMWQKQYQAGAKLDELVKGLRGETSTVASVLDTMRSQGKTLADNYFAQLPDKQKIDFIFKMQKVGPEGMTDPVQKAVGMFMKEMNDSRVRAIQDLDTGLLGHIDANAEGNENFFFAQYWKKPEEAQKAIMLNISKRPIEGQKSFAEGRVFADVHEGLALGYELVSNNPVDLFFMKMGEMDKYIAAHTMLQGMEKDGLATLRPSDEFLPAGETNVLGTFGTVKRREAAPDNWTATGQKDDMGNPTYRDEKGDIKTADFKTFKYGVREDVAQVINNYLSPSLYNNKYIGTAFTGFMNMANHLNQFQLGVGSLFHAGFTTGESVISHVTLGMMAISDGNIKKGLGYLVSAPLEIYRNPIRGNQILAEWANPGSTSNSNIRNMALIQEGLNAAGFRKEMDTRFQTHITESTLNAWANGNKIGAAVRAPFAMVEQLSRPIMEWLVPRQKAGVFGERFNYWLDEHPNASASERRQAAGEIMNRIDSILGQVNYDRLMVNNIAKNFVQAALRAPGWTGGTILELTGGFKDLGQLVKNISSGKKPNMSARTAYTLSLVLTTAVTNGILTMLFTGEQPEGNDFLAFRTGNTDEHGFAERFMLPSYMKDMWAYWNDAPGTLGAKVHPAIGMIKNVAQNKDYYGTEIRHEGDNIAEQFSQVLGFTVKQFVPFWMRGVQKEQERGGSLAAEALPFLGVMPAPAELNRTPAEKMVRQFMVARTPSMTKTAVEMDRGKLISKLTRSMRAGDPGADNDIQEAVSNGEISTRAARQIKKDAGLTPLEVGFKRLSLDEANKVMEKARPDEQEVLAPLLAKKQVSQKKLYPGGTAEEQAPQ